MIFGTKRNFSRKALAVGLIAFLLGGCANNEEQDDLVRNVTDAYKKAQSSVENGNYRRAIQIYETLRARFPFSELSKQIELELMHAYYKSNQTEQAVDLAEQFVRENPTHPRVDYALYIEGLAYFEGDRGFLERIFNKSIDARPPRNAERAFDVFSRLVRRYPASEYAADAEQRMIYLKNRLASYENSVARYYIKTRAYVAALNRARGAVERYHGADSNQESLQIMIQAYEGLGMTDLANDTRRVLAANSAGG